MSVRADNSHYFNTFLNSRLMRKWVSVCRCAFSAWCINTFTKNYIVFCSSRFWAGILFFRIKSTLKALWFIWVYEFYITESFHQLSQSCCVWEQLQPHTLCTWVWLHLLLCGQVKNKKRSPPSHRSPSSSQRIPHHSSTTDEQESPERLVRV